MVQLLVMETMSDHSQARNDGVDDLRWGPGIGCEKRGLSTEISAATRTTGCGDTKTSDWPGARCRQGND